MSSPTVIYKNSVRVPYKNDYIRTMFFKVEQERPGNNIFIRFFNWILRRKTKNPRVYRVSIKEEICYPTNFGWSVGWSDTIVQGGNIVGEDALYEYVRTLSIPKEELKPIVNSFLDYITGTLSNDTAS